MYHEITRKAFEFCITYKRNAEFRRLCELLRHHLYSIAKFQTQYNAVDLSNPDTLRRYLETRFVQLESASTLELWQEAYRTIEDIFDNMQQCNNVGIESSPALMKIYYKKLSDIFYASENYLFHAYSLHRYYILLHAAAQQSTDDIHNKNNQQLTQQQLADAVLLATLVIPQSEHDGTSGDSNDMLSVEHDGAVKLAALLGFKREQPSRSRLLHSVVATQTPIQVLSESSESMKKLYDLLEEQYSPLSLYKHCSPILESIESNTLLSRYVQPLKSLIVQRVLQQLSTVYKTIKLQKFYQLIPSFDIQSIERIIMNTIQSNTVSLRIDHHKQLLVFQDEGIDSVRMRDQLVQLSRSLNSITNKLQPIDIQSKSDERTYVFQLIRSGVHNEHSAVFARQQEIEKRKQLLELQQSQKQQLDYELKQKLLAERKADESKRLLDEANKREAERIKREQQEKEYKFKQKIAEQVMKRVEEAASKVGLNTAIKKLTKLTENLDSIDTATIQQAQESIILAERKETERRRRDALKRSDYLTRAIRHEERDLLLDGEKQRKLIDSEQFELDYIKFIESDQLQHEKSVHEKYRLNKALQHKHEFIHNIIQRRTIEFNEQRDKIESLARSRAVVRIKQQRRDELIQRKQAELEAKRIQLQLEQEADAERIRAEEQAKRDALREQKLRERAELDAAAKRQLERQEEFERKQRERDARINIRNDENSNVISGGSTSGTSAFRSRKFDVDDRVPIRRTDDETNNNDTNTIHNNTTQSSSDKWANVRRKDPVPYDGDNTRDNRPQIRGNRDPRSNERDERKDRDFASLRNRPSNNNTNNE